MTPPDEKAGNGRRRRSRSRKTSSSTASADAKTSSETSTTAARKTRRGRRGGAGRKSKKAPDTAPTTAVEAPEASPASNEPATLETLLERQLDALKSVQSSLSSIENRLADGGAQAFGGERPRLGIFVDVPNVMYAAERQKVKLDYAKLLDFLTRGRELVRASAYAPISDDSGERFDSQRFIQPFANLGYRLVTKPHKRYADGSMKANFDVELAIDVVAMSDRLDVVSLVSGDGDFRRLVELVASKGVRVEVIAFSQSTAQELRAVADQYIDLNDYLAELKAGR